MKKTLFTLGLGLVMATSAYSQGVVAFANVGGGLNAPIFLNTTGNNLPTTYSVDLLVGTSAGSVSTLVGSKTLASAGYFTATSGTTLPSGFNAGTTYFFQARAYETAAGSFAASATKGSSSVFSFTAASGTGNPPPLPGFFTAGNDPNSLGGLQSFIVTAAVIPEPTTVVLGVMGGLALLLRRRK